jgi:hypothetical protein
MSSQFGYLHPGYASSLAEFGTPLRLPGSEGFLLRRKIPNSMREDLMAPYPLFVCANWDRLPEDLHALENQYVSLVAVADPINGPDTAILRRAFPEFVKPFKEHFVVDCSVPLFSTLSKHHRYYSRRALREVEVEVTADCAPLLDDWCSLYRALCARHGLTGIKAFSRNAFAIQLSLPGTIAIVARAGGHIVGMHLWYLQGNCAYSHLAAFNDEGYRLMAAYALYHRAIEHFSERVEVVHLGAGAGLASDETDGLTRFKRGWATGFRMAYLCGRVLDPVAFEELSRLHPPTEYFPCYRNGELE